MNRLSSGALELVTGMAEMVDDGGGSDHVAWPRHGRGHDPHLSRVLPETAQNKPVEIWFQDEARVGQKGSLSYVWAPIGSRPPMLRDNRHGSAYLLGAICPARGVGAAIIAPAANIEYINAHLQELSTQVSPGSTAVVVWDGAGWHQTGGRLKLPDNIVLLSLPPYAPELNPMENV